MNQTNFKGTFTKTGMQNSDYSIVAFNSDLDFNFKLANRIIKQENKSQNLSDTKELTNVAWIYDLNGTQNPMYQFEFTYYGPASATLYFPYKLAKANDKDNLSLKYKLNDLELQDIVLNDPKVDDIKVAAIRLSNLAFGKNTISFTTDNNKVTPMIGNMYISSINSSAEKVYNDIFSNELSNNSNSITVNFIKGYGIANKSDTIIRKLNAALDDSGSPKDHYLIGYLGNGGSTNPKTNEKYCSFYVNAPQSGAYTISGSINSGENRGLRFWSGTYENQQNIVKFLNLKSGDNWSGLKSFSSSTNTMNNKKTITLEKGINKIFVSADEATKDAPNLGNVTFTLTPSSNPS
ncbi:hypothetical protein LNO71_02695 [Mycoplasma sp. T264T]|uniref:Haemagglutinin Mycoplasma domain-containing protein n=2 Tax=Mycoplasma bradburyae TaxID=2963128 RepID=A0AAW6HQB3_9MOLU|nr:hypothetical protein [Mycoplasma bradburyae]